MSLRASRFFSKVVCDSTLCFVAGTAAAALALCVPVGHLMAQATPSAAPQAAAPQTAAPVNVPQVAPLPTTNNSGDNQNWGNGQNQNSQQQQNQQTRNNQNQQQASAAAQPLAPTEFQILVAGTAGRILPVFGTDLFNASPSTFAPIGDAPVTGDYVIGPGDEIRLSTTGQLNRQGSFTVDRLGDISVPEVGPIHVSGVRYSELTHFIRSQMERVYRNFELNVSMGQLRSIQVFVVGQARRPGVYTISSLSTLLNALFASGGPSGTGSLRRIELRRGSTVVTELDLYDFLLRGDKSKDVRLEPGDVIFIPQIGPQVAITGSVNTPAIFELRNEASISQLLQLAGGFSAVASSALVRVESIYEHRERVFQDVDLNSSAAFPVHNGDIVAVGSITDRFRETVTLRGNVANPGRYTWHAGMHVRDLIPNKDSLVTRAYYRSITALGQSTNDYGAVDTGLNTTSAAAATPSTRGSNTATGINAGGGTVTGDLNGPSSTTMASTANTGARNDVVLPAPDINWDYAVIERQDAAGLNTTLLPFRLGDLVLRNDESQNLALEPGDVVTIFSQADLRVPSAHQTRFIHLEGEFVSAGVYSVLPGETLRQVIQRAGGLTPDAFLYASEFTRESTRRIQQQRLSDYADSLEAQIDTQASKAISNSSGDAAGITASLSPARQTVNRLRGLRASGRIVLQLKPDDAGINAIPDMALEDGDRFVVSRKPTTVLVQGQVFSPNAFLFQPGKRVKDYLHIAGGPDRTADKSRIFVIRADGSVISKQFGNLDHAPIFAGDTVVVPPQIKTGSLLRDLAFLSTTVNAVSQLGLLAAVVLTR
jgi:polysaccharide biosynthesis/export protein